MELAHIYTQTLISLDGAVICDSMIKLSVDPDSIADKSNLLIELRKIAISSTRNEIHRNQGQFALLQMDMIPNIIYEVRFWDEESFMNIVKEKR